MFKTIKINVKENGKIYKFLRLIPGIPGCLGRFDLKKGGGQMKNGAVTGSISQIETLLRLSPAVDSSQPTCSIIQKAITLAFYHCTILIKKLCHN